MGSPHRWDLIGIDTQAENVRGLRAYSRVGFAPDDPYFTVTPVVVSVRWPTIFMAVEALRAQKRNKQTKRKMGPFLHHITHPSPMTL